MKLAEKFFNQSYENEKRLRLEAEKAKAEQLKSECNKIFERIILPKIETAVKNSLYATYFKVSDFDKINYLFASLKDLLSFLESEGFKIIDIKYCENVIFTFGISWKLDKTPMTEDPQYR
jgi:hypothetical protein